MKSLGRTCRQIIAGTLALIALTAVPSAAQSTDEAVDAVIASGARARVIMQFATTVERDAAFNRLLDRGAAVRATDTEGGPALVVLGSSTTFGSEVANARRVSLDAKVRVSTFQAPARASTGAAIRAKKILKWQNQLGAADNGGVAVAVIDSGFTPHVDLPISRLRYYKDFVSNTSVPVDGCGHGTHVSGIVAGSGASSPGRKYAGVAPQVELVVLRVLDENCSGNTSDVIDALEWVARNHETHRIKVVNLSLGHDVLESIFTDPMVQAVERLSRKGIAVVTAAGNKGYKVDANGDAVLGVDGNPIRVHGGVGVPCNAPSSICVGSLNTIQGDSNFDHVAFSSSAGPTRFDMLAKPDLVAPGVKIVSLAAPGSRLYRDYAELTAPDAPGYFTLSGTSMASPSVAAAAALILEANKHLSANALKMSLQFTSRVLVNADGQASADVLTQGAGALNLGGAMTLASAIRSNARFGKPWLRRALVASNTDSSGRTIQWGRRIIYGDRFMNPRYAQIHLVRWEDDIVWGYDTIDENVVWGNSADDNVVWGNEDNVVWGNDDNVVWGNAEDANVVWGNGEADNVVWGNAVDPSLQPDADDAIVWDIDDENVVWGNDTDNVVWGNGDTDNVVWGNGLARHQWSSSLIAGFSDDNVVWGNVSYDELDNVVWGNDDENVVWGNCSDASVDENVVWGNTGGDNVVWGNSDNVVWGNCDNVVWGNDGENVVWGNSVLTGSGR